MITSKKSPVTLNFRDEKFKFKKEEKADFVVKKENKNIKIDSYDE